MRKQLAVILCAILAQAQAQTPTPRQFINDLMTNSNRAGLQYVQQPSLYCTDFQLFISTLIPPAGSLKAKNSSMKLWAVLQYTRRTTSADVVKSELSGAVNRFKTMHWDSKYWEGYRILKIDQFKNYSFYVKVPAFADSLGFVPVCIAIVSYSGN